jgi:hypothetical protein
LPLDDFLPHYDTNEIHSTWIAAPPAAVEAAARALTSRDVPLMTALMSLRRLPGAILRRPHSAPAESLDLPMLDHFTRAGFVVLADGADELVLGAVGRFWTVDSGIRRVSSDDFVAFDEPGFAKAVMNFHVREVSGGSVLTTETRIRGTDDEARRKFERYWRIVMPASALIRRAWLRAIRRRAENC